MFSRYEKFSLSNQTVETVETLGINTLYGKKYWDSYKSFQCSRKAFHEFLKSFYVSFCSGIEIRALCWRVKFFHIDLWKMRLVK